MSSADTRGSGFVHLNTPSSISYTKGQTVSLSDLSRHRTRVECVSLPASLMTPWREAIRQYTRLEGFQPFAADAEAERMGEGPILPLLSTTPARNAADASFFHARYGESLPGVAKADPSIPSGSNGDNGVSTAPPSSTSSGIKIMSHHKVTGVNEFVYPDHDGVLSGGVVPEIIITAEEKAEKEAARAFYTSPLTMSQEELDAFEELQMLWRSRARSHSALGAHHRQLAGGTLAPGQEGDGEESSHGGGLVRLTRPREDAGRPIETLLEDEARVDDVTDDMLAEALRMADDLLQLN